MRNEWILDVLADLRDFAARNELDALAYQLAQAEVTAIRELTPGGDDAPVLGRRDMVNAGRIYRTVGASQNA